MRRHARIVALGFLSLLAMASTGVAETVFVAGGSGRSGFEIVKALSAAGYSVKASTRSVERAREKFGTQYDWVQLDMLDPVATDKMLEGVDIVVSALGHGDMVGVDSPQVVHNLAVRNLIDAAKAHRVKQLVLMSSSTAGHAADHRKEPRFGFVLHWMTKSEDQLIASGIPFTIIGPGGLIPGEPDKVGARLIPRSEYKRAMVSRVSVAHAVVLALKEPGAKGKAVALVADPATKPGQIVGQYAAIPAERAPAPAAHPKE